MDGLRDALWIPLGTSVTTVITSLAARALVEPRRVLAGLPHPSGANAERIAYFMGRKERAKRSTKADPARVDAARSALFSQIAALTR